MGEHDTAAPTAGVTANSATSNINGSNSGSVSVNGNSNGSTMLNNGSTTIAAGNINGSGSCGGGPTSTTTTTSSSSSSSTIQPSTAGGKLFRVGFYDIEKTIGKGNFAVVKLARHRVTKNEVSQILFPIHLTRC